MYYTNKRISGIDDEAISRRLLVWIIVCSFYVLYGITLRRTYRKILYDTFNNFAISYWLVVHFKMDRQVI